MAVTIKDIAQAAGVSTTTVLRALNNKGRINRHTKEQILKIADELNYIPNAIARGLITKRTGLLGLMIADVSNPLYAELAKGVEFVAAKNGYRVVIINTDRRKEQEDTGLIALQEMRVDGAILSVTSEVSLFISKLDNLTVPYVLLEEVPELVDMDYVTFDDAQGAYDACRYLLALGHKDIAVLTLESEGEHAVEKRMQGVVRAYTEFDLTLSPSRVIATYGTPLDGAKAAEKIINMIPRPTAVFVMYDLLAIGLIKGLFEQGITVPDDISVVGFDNIAISEFFIPSLTTVHLPKFELGSIATEMLLNIIDNGKRGSTQKLLQPELVIRQSCVPLRRI